MNSMAQPQTYFPSDYRGARARFIEAAEENGWNLNYGGIALMWRGGCIIRSVFLGKIKDAFDNLVAGIDKGIKAALEILPSLRPYPLGHIGDGNVHFGFGAPKGMDRATLQQYAPAITRAVNDLITSMAGSISAEHGIGIEKLDELQHYRSKIELDTMRTIKRALDPKNIMNPGKVLRLS